MKIYKIYARRLYYSNWVYILRTLMNLRPVQTVCLLLIFSSCKSLQRLSAHDNSSNTTASSKKGNPQFLDNVSITPGENKNPDYTYNKPAQSGNKKSFANNTSSSFNIEKADWLQIKYAIITDMPVEQLYNLPLLQQIDHWWGTRYCMGGSDENCIDCSAFTQTMLRNVYGVEVPRTAQEQYDFSTHIKDDELREGDLVFFKSGRSITHVGLYVGNSKFVNASTSGGVTISDLNDNYWSKKYAGAGRVIQ
jgi:cell wall-associated NlpC family hydrolase